MINNGYDFTVRKLESTPNDTNVLISPYITIKWFNMVRNESKEESNNPAMASNPKPEGARNVIETMKDSVMVVTNEVAKFQPQLQYAQSISDLQIQYLDATRNILNNVSTIQRNFVGNNYWKGLVTLAPQYSEQIRNQSNEAINYFSRSAEIGNQVAIKSIDLARENIKNIVQAIASIQALNTNLWNSWISHFGSRHDSKS